MNQNERQDKQRESASVPNRNSAVQVLVQVVDKCTDACSRSEELETPARKQTYFERMKKLGALYLTMVLVSSLAIYFLEHASILGAVRTALVAAVGKTVAASWVTSFFE